MIDLSGVITGPTNITGLTSPTWTNTTDLSAKPGTSRKWVVTALGGTQTGVSANSVVLPFWSEVSRPETILAPGLRNSATGAYNNVRYNVWRWLCVKGANLVNGLGAGAQYASIVFDFRFKIPDAIANDSAQLAAIYGYAAAILWAKAEQFRSSNLDGTV